METITSNPDTYNITEDQYDNQSLVRQVFELYCRLINTGYEDIKMIYNILIIGKNKKNTNVYLNFAKKRYDNIDKFYRIVMSSYDKLINKTSEDDDLYLQTKTNAQHSKRKYRTYFDIETLDFAEVGMEHFIIDRLESETLDGDSIQSDTESHEDEDNDEKPDAATSEA